MKKVTIYTCIKYIEKRPINKAGKIVACHYNIYICPKLQFRNVYINGVAKTWTKTSLKKTKR